MNKKEIYAGRLTKMQVEMNTVARHSENVPRESNLQLLTMSIVSDSHAVRDTRVW